MCFHCTQWFFIHLNVIQRLLISIVLFYTLTTQAQSTVSGMVTDQTSGLPLEFVAVSTIDDKSGDITDEKGFFRLSVQKFPVVLRFRLIGYETRTIQISNGKESIEISLEPSTSILNTVEINSSKIHRVAGNKKRSIWDYTWWGENIVLSEYGTSLKKSRIIHINTDSDTIDVVNAPAKPLSLFTDCLGNPHVQGQDSTWQLIEEQHLMYFLPAESNHLIDNLLKFCACASDSNLYFAIPTGKSIFDNGLPVGFRFETSSHNMYYFFSSRETQKMNFLTSIADVDALKLIAEEQSFGRGPDGKPQKPTIERNRDEDAFFFYNILLKEIYAPMFLVKDTVLLFDHIHSKIVFFETSGEVLETVSIDYHLNPDFAREIIVDEEKRRVFVLFKKGGITELRQLNPYTGLLCGSWKIPTPFPDHITVRGNYIYYLHRDEEIHEARILSRLSMD
jgi:hypothetical protein